MITYMNNWTCSKRGLCKKCLMNTSQKNKASIKNEYDKNKNFRNSNIKMNEITTKMFGTAVKMNKISPAKKGVYKR